MKNSLALILLLGPFLLAAQSTDNTIVKSQPEAVMVYLSGAQVNSKASANLKAGRQTLVFEKLSNTIDANSVQVKADADVTILSVNYELNYLKPQDYKEFKDLEDSVKWYRDQVARLQINRRAHEEELSLLASNKSIGGANVGVNTAELAKMADFLRTRVQDAALKKYEIEQKERKLNERISTLEAQMNNMRSNELKPTGEVIVQVNAAAAGQANFELSYYTTNCGWTPSYDIRVKDVNSKAIVAAKANVYQNTGQPWKNVKLSLSTGNPSRGNTKPALNPWWLSLSENPPVRTYYKKTEEYRTSRAPVAAGAVSEDAAMPAALSEVTISAMREKSKTPSQFTQVVGSNTNSVFSINLPYSIASDGSENYVEIQQYEIDAAYKHFGIPKVDPDAFLLAELLGWDKGELLPGDANVYFENNYVGKTYFDTRIADDTLSVALGRDNNVVIKRKMVKELNERTSVNNTMKKVTRNFEIDVRNTRKAPIELEIEDQIPLSNNEQLTVEAIDTGKAEYNKETGKLTWRLKLQPGESTKLSFSYSVRYPKKFILNGL